nr:PREDICTED: importin subunit alpha-2-like isoform X2 [Daucus carota subsp. sativus]
MEEKESYSSMRITRNRPDILRNYIPKSSDDPPAIAQLLEFSVKRKRHTFIHLIREIKDGFHNGQMEKIEKCTDELRKMITEDPRLALFLDVEFLELLVELLKCEQYSNLQVHAATIFEPVVTFFLCRKDVKDLAVIIERIIPIVSRLICFGVYLVQALWLLRSLVPVISKYEVEEILSPVASLIIEDSTSFNVLHAASETLLVACEKHPKISPEKLKLALPALMKLIESNILMLLTSGSWGLAFLCDGRGEMIVEDKYLECLITRLVDVMNDEERVMILSALHAMGSVVKWGSDDVIEIIIKEDGALLILLVLLEEDDLYIVKQTCWILSNITARKEKHIRAIIDGVPEGKLIDPLVKIMLNCNLNDVRKEAAWAISNAMCGVGIDQIECLRNSCSNIIWADLLNSFSSDRLFVLVTLEGLLNIRVAEVTWKGNPVDAVTLHSFFESIVEGIDRRDSFIVPEFVNESDGWTVSGHSLFPEFLMSDDYALNFKFEDQRCSNMFIDYNGSMKFC